VWGRGEGGGFQSVCLFIFYFHPESEMMNEINLFWLAGLQNMHHE
jgi:hypothetical protein